MYPPPKMHLSILFLFTAITWASFSLVMFLLCHFILWLWGLPHFSLYLKQNHSTHITTRWRAVRSYHPLSPTFNHKITSLPLYLACIWNVIIWLAWQEGDGLCDLIILVHQVWKIIIGYGHITYNTNKFANKKIEFHHAADFAVKC